MPPAPIPSNEPDRLAELFKYKVLDTPPEESFDDLTQLAKAICQAPIALVSLVDADRQWFKSCLGLDAKQTHRSQAFCAYTILTDEPFIITDALQDDRVKDNLLVLHPPLIRFYAGVPLISPRGYRLGSLCVIDYVPRLLSEQQLDALKTLAKQVVYLLESRLYQEQLAEYTQTLEETNHAKTKFISTLSHEIRTPLNGVLGSLQLLEDTALGPIQMEYFRTAQTCGKAILTLINEVLDLAKLEVGKVELVPQPTNLLDLITEVKTIVSSLLTPKSLNLIIDHDHKIPDYLDLDPDRLRQILLNLTSNAIKFSPQGDVITCKVSLLNRSEHQAIVEFQIIDRGIGLSTEEQARILTPFAQASAHINKVYGGSGLGLSITNELLRLMASRLVITSAPGRGSTFAFTLVSPIGKKPEENPSILPPPPDRRLNILVAEDNAVNQMVISRALKRKGHRVTMTENGQEAVDKFQTRDFDLVILDLEMPVMGGEAAARLMGKINPQVPILGLSAMALSEVQDKIRSVMDGYLTKPIDFRLLETTIQTLVTNSELTAQKNGSSGI